LLALKLDAMLLESLCQHVSLCGWHSLTCFFLVWTDYSISLRRLL